MGTNFSLFNCCTYEENNQNEIASTENYTQISKSNKTMQDKLENTKNIIDINSKCDLSRNFRSQHTSAEFEKFDQNLKLILEIKNNSSSTKLILTKDGIPNSLRNQIDGKTYFGYFNKNQSLNDYLIDSEISESENYCGRQFVINWDSHFFSYFIKDLSNNSGCFKLMDKPINLINTMLFKLGNSYMVAILDGEDNKLKVKTFSNTHQTESDYFSAIEGMVVTIGRCSDCNIVIDDELVSRSHCTIKFESGNWNIYDGSIQKKSKLPSVRKSSNEEQIKSLNSTWIYIYEYTKIYNGMVFKHNDVIFKVFFIYFSVIWNNLY